MLEEGDQIDIWVVERALGSGGMGSVYRCHNRTAVRILAAVKVLEGNLRKFKEAEARFIREAEILFQLDHPNIVKVRNIRTDMDPPYLEMEFVEGESLESLLRKGPLSYELSVQYLKQMTSAVAYLHSQGVRHRDIKPANLLVKKDGNIKLVDFGLAMEADTERITQQGMTFGTVSYAPPEWITPDILDPSQWDIYALGVVFYEMLTGNLAFPVSGQGSVRQQAMQVIVGKQNHAPLDVGSKFPDDLRELVMAMCHSDPGQRIQTAEDVNEQAQSLISVGPRPTGVTLLPSTGFDEGGVDTPSAATERPGAHDPNTWVTGGAAPERTSLPGDTGSAPTNVQLSPNADAVAPRRSVVFPTLVGTALAMTLLTVGLLSALAVWGPQSGRSARPLEVTVTGLPTDSPVSITLGNQIPNRTAGFVHHFDRVPVGSNDLTWVQGDRCSLSDCPGNACPSWCFTQTMEIQVEPGTGIHPIKVNLTPAPKRSVRITADGLTKPWDLTFKLGDVVGNAEDNAVVFRDITPGTYALEALVGRCPSEARGCWPDGECPAGCAAYIDDFIVPWGDDEYTWALELADPRPAPVVAARPSNDRDTRPAPVPTRGAATAPVTNALFSSWLASHDDWHRETAMAAERADKNYLGNWDGVVPPSQTGAATNISWYAAAAFCKSRGGLASVEAEPHRWSESASQPYVEWRVDAGKAAWRSSDGRSSSKGVVLKTSNGVTGFRCAE